MLTAACIVIAAVAWLSTRPTSPTSRQEKEECFRWLGILHNTSKESYSNHTYFFFSSHCFCLSTTAQQHSAIFGLAGDNVCIHLCPENSTQTRRQPEMKAQKKQWGQQSTKKKKIGNSEKQTGKVMEKRLGKYPLSFFVPLRLSKHPFTPSLLHSKELSIQPRPTTKTDQPFPTHCSSFILLPPSHRHCMIHKSRWATGSLDVDSLPTYFSLFFSSLSSTQFPPTDPLLPPTWRLWAQSLLPSRFLRGSGFRPLLFPFFFFPFFKDLAPRIPCVTI